MGGPTGAGLCLDDDAGEVGYRLFLVLYGSVLPAYVLIVVLPWRRQVDPDLVSDGNPRGDQLRRRRLWVWAVVSGVTYVLGLATFVLDMGWAAVVSAVVLVLGVGAVAFRR